jgi:hypothetical protein
VESNPLPQTNCFILFKPVTVDKVQKLNISKYDTLSSELYTILEEARKSKSVLQITTFSLKERSILVCYHGSITQKAKCHTTEDFNLQPHCCDIFKSSILSCVNAVLAPHIQARSVLTH